VHPPSSKHLNITALSKIFDDTTNSYKFLLFNALLKLLQSEGDQKNNSLFSLQLVGVKMAAQAWWVNRYYKLLLGENDTLSNQLQKISDQLQSEIPTKTGFESNLEKVITSNFEDLEFSNTLLRYVPFRLMRPFSQKATTGIVDSKVNKIIESELNATFDSESPPLYKIVRNNSTFIEINAEWKDYLLEHHRILQAWCELNFIKYLQSKNPNAPAVAKKIYPPESIRNLTAQRKYWESILLITSVQCIYSGKNINPNNFHLDHFLPRSYVCHDELWNLIPVCSKVNLEKAASIPHEYYLDKFSELQFEGIQFAKKIFPLSKLDKYILSFNDGLKISNKDIDDRKKLLAAYRDTIQPLSTIAKRMGFSHSWRYVTEKSIR